MELLLQLVRAHLQNVGQKMLGLPIGSGDQFGSNLKAQGALMTPKLSQIEEIELLS
jgi:hypothetical protein